MMEGYFSRQKSVRPWKVAAFLFAVIFLCRFVPEIFGATVEASLDNGGIILGDSATLSLEINGGSADAEPAAPQVSGLRIERRGTSQQFSFANGVSISKYIYTYAVTPQRAGEFTIPPIRVTVAGQTLSSQPLQLTATKATAPSPEAINAGTQLAFMKLKLPKTHVYAGEVFIAELDIYLRDSVQNFGNFQLTAMPADGFTIGKNTEGQHRREQVGNSIYNVIPLLLSVTAVKAGDFTIGPITANLVVQLPANNNRRNRDPFGGFDDDPFGMFRRVENRPVNLATEAHTVQTLPLPLENQPRNFSGAVGDYSMTITAGPTNVTAGDPITLRMQISGTGALDLISLPPQAEKAWQDFKSYPPTTKVDTTDSLGIQGTKTFEEIVVPQNSDVHELPPISFSFFNPDTEKYEVLTQPAVALTVKPGGANMIPTIAAAQNHTDNPPPPTQDIVPIKQRLGSTSAGTVLIETKWFLAAQSLPMLAWMAGLIWRKRKDSLANNPRLRRQREVARILETGLARLRTLARENKSEDFFATLFHLLQEKLGERLDLPASAITEAVVEERLRPQGVSDTTIQSVAELFQLCNLARYAPMRSSQELAAVVPKLEDTLKKLDEVNA